MAPVTGTPDYAASFKRIAFLREPGVRVRALLPASLPILSIVLAGCVAQPPVQDAGGRTVHDGRMHEDPTAEVAPHAPGSPSGTGTGHDGSLRLSTEGRSSELANAVESATPVDTRSRIPAGARSDDDAAVAPDTWVRIRQGISLPHPLPPRVMREIAWYAKNQEYIHRITQRARPYMPYIARQVEERDLPIEFALLPVVESAFRVSAYSRARALGLWQFIPSTGRLYGLKQNWWYDGRRDVVASTRAALDYLSKLLVDFDGDRLLAVAAYNWGEGNVRRAMRRNRARGKPTDVWSLRLPGETRAHVSRLLAFAAIVEDPERHGVVLDPILDRVPFEAVPLDSQIELVVAANLAGITLDEVKQFNPGFKRAATDPNGPHRLYLPAHAVQQFRANLAKVPVEKRRVHWARHVVARGDTLGALAVRYRTTVAALKNINRLGSDRIIAGRHLMIPTSAGAPGASQAGDATRIDHTAARPDTGTSIHRVRSGDSLWRIARKHGVNMRQLAMWNGLSLQAVLRPGQRLTVHGDDSAPERAAPPKPAAQSFTAPPVAIHVVERGDTLSGIAMRHGTTVRELTRFNHIDRSTILRPGQKLRLVSAAYSQSPANRGSIRYRVKRGDSLWGISQQFGVSVASLREWNRLSKGELLMPGRELDVRVAQAPAI